MKIIYKVFVTPIYSDYIWFSSQKKNINALEVIFIL